MMLILLVVLNVAMVTLGQKSDCPEKNPVCKETPVDIALVIDSTASIHSYDNFQLGLEFLRKFLEPFEISPISVRVAAVMFGYGVYTDSAFNFDTYANKQETLNAISNLPWMGGNTTETFKGIDYMVNNFVPRMRPGKDVAHVGIILTDGQSQNKEETRKAAERARARGLTLIAIGVGKPMRNLREPKNGVVDLDELDDITGTNDYVLTENDFSKLKLITDNLIDTFCTGVAQNTLRKKPRN
ncbi:hypothetical protein Btru_053864 [Bulinus truncatus]|nr:hypothetical protein Btru_053864 [Bulinus truncatus]